MYDSISVARVNDAVSQLDSIERFQVSSRWFTVLSGCYSLLNKSPDMKIVSVFMFMSMFINLFMFQCRRQDSTTIGCFFLGF